MSNELELPFLSNIGIVMTYKCQIACPHCILEAGPDREEEISIKDAYDWIIQITNFRNKHIKVLSLTGGEPFYNMEKLKNISDFADKSGLLVTAATNAFWASTPKKAVKILEKLPEIRALQISADAYHQKYIPFRRVRNAILAALKRGIPHYLAVCTENVDDEEYKQILKRLHELTTTDNIRTVITFPVGRASKELANLNYQTSTEPPLSVCRACGYPVIFPDGRVIACIGPLITLHSKHPLLLGNLFEKPLNSIFDEAELNPILHTLRIWGPKKLVYLIKEAGLGRYLPNRFVQNSVCYACYAMMSCDKIVDFFDRLANDYEFKREVAYARSYYLKENEMVIRLNFE